MSPALRVEECSYGTLSSASQVEDVDDTTIRDPEEIQSSLQTIESNQGSSLPPRSSNPHMDIQFDAKTTALVVIDLQHAIVSRETTRLLESMRGTAGHIFNLGHGILPQAKLECVEALIGTVTRWK